MKKVLKLIAIFLVVASLSAGFTAVAAAPKPAMAAAAVQSSSSSPDATVNIVKGPSVQQRLTTRAKSSWPWYVTRAAGLTAAVLLVLLILSGTGLISGATYKFLEPLNAWATHRALGLAFAVAATVHIVALLFDHYVKFSVAAAFLPFVSNYKSVTIAGHHLGSLYVALGIIALYLMIAIVISSILWIDKKPRIWKLTHFLVYLVMIFVFIHALYLGTDLAHGVFRDLWLAFGVIMALAVLRRLRRARSI